MNEDFSRVDRVAVMMQRTLSKAIQQEVKDPRLSGWVTISDIKLTKDLRQARVYFTLLNDDPKVAEVVLNSAASYLRRKLAKTLTLRVVPTLRFVYDDSVAYGHHLSHLIDKVNINDEPDDDTE